MLFKSKNCNANKKIMTLQEFRDSKIKNTGKNIFYKN